MSPVYRFCKLGTSKACLQFSSCHFTTLTFWFINFLGINRIGLAEYFFSISATPLRVLLFYFLRVPQTLVQLVTFP